jgi:hypothetical protein
MRLVATAAALLSAACLLSCATQPGSEAFDNTRQETTTQSYADAIAEGMARARLDLARREIRRRLMQAPG